MPMCACGFSALAEPAAAVRGRIASVVGSVSNRGLQVTSLRRLLENDINEHVQRITEVSDTASREWSIEKALQKMQEDWEGLAFELAPWKETGTFILKGGPVEEAQVRRAQPACPPPSPPPTMSSNV